MIIVTYEKQKKSPKKNKTCGFNRFPYFHIPLSPVLYLCMTEEKNNYTS